MQAALFDLLSAVMNSVAIWSKAAGDQGQGQAWRDAVTRRITTSPAYVPYEQLVDAVTAEVGLPREAAVQLSFQRAARAPTLGIAVDGGRKPRPVGTPRPVRAPWSSAISDMFSLAQAHNAFTEEGRIANAKLQERFDVNIANFMDLVEAAKRYPCVKRAWVEYLGEHPDPAIDRVQVGAG